jgi:hypothetical protein
MLGIRASVFLVAIATLLSGCGGGGACDFDSRLRERAGAGAVNCGHVVVGASAVAVNQCVADQTARAAPFYARYDVQGTDSSVAYGVVRSAQGQSSVWFFDSDPSGGSNVGAHVAQTVCGGDPPLQVAADPNTSSVPVSCTVAATTTVICGG